MGIACKEARMESVVDTCVLSRVAKSTAIELNWT
jgi:hypothetical protein